MLTTAPSLPLIQVKKVSKGFPGVQALAGVDLEIQAGEVVALLGENGAGKSTLMKIIAGVYPPDQGEVYVNGRRVAHETVQLAQQLGISIIYQEFNLTPNQTVTANLHLGREPRRPGVLGRLGLVDAARARREAFGLLQRVGAHFSPDTLVRTLSVAEQQMVEIAKSLATRSQVLIMDEPTSALGKEEVAVLFGIIRALKAQGLGIVFITHRLEEVFEIADRIVILRDGKLVKKLAVHDATAPELITALVGRPLEAGAHVTSATEALALEVTGLSRGAAPRDVSLSVRRGEIVGIAGLVGAGRTETVRAIFGADRPDAGEIRIAGRPVPIRSPHDAVAAGLALVPENRQTQGLVIRQSIARNILLPNLTPLARAGVVNTGRARQLVAEFIRRLDIRTPHAEQRAVNLSGGNQQKVVLAKWLAAEPTVLILDEPTRGIDVGAKAEIYALMRELARQGMGIIMVSSELPEILLMSDRIVVMCEGRVSGTLARAAATQEKIMAYASGHPGPAEG